MKKKILGAIGISILAYFVYDNRTSIIEFISDLFQPSISDIKRIRYWRIPLSNYGIYTLKDLIEEAEKHGLQRIKHFKGIGEIGLYEIRLVLHQKTGIWYGY